MEVAGGPDGIPRIRPERPAELLTEIDLLIAVVDGRSGIGEDDPPTSVLRVEAARRLAETAEAYPVAVGQVAVDILSTLSRLRPATPSDAATLPASDRLRAAQQLCRGLVAIAEQVPEALANEVETLAAILADGEMKIQFQVAKILSLIAERDPNSIDEGVVQPGLFFEPQHAALQRAGADYIAELAEIRPERCVEALPELIRCLEMGDSTIRKKAANAIHEISIYDPEAVVPDVDAIASGLPYPGDDTNVLTLLILNELTGLEPAEVWEHIDVIASLTDRKHDRIRVVVAILLTRIAIVDVELLAERPDIIATTLQDQSVDVCTSLDLAVRRLASHHPQPATGFLEEALAAAVKLQSKPEFVTHMLLAAHWIVESTGATIDRSKLEGVADLLSASESDVRSSTAVLLRTVQQNAATDVDSLVSDVVTESDQLDVDADDPPLEVLDAIRSQAETEGGELDTTPQDGIPRIQPEYLFLRQPDIIEVIERARQQIQAGEATALSDLDTLIGYLDSQSQLVERMVIRLLPLFSLRYPVAVSRYTRSIAPLAASPRPDIRNHAQRTLFILSDHDPTLLTDAVAPIVESLSYDDPLTRQLGSRSLLNIVTLAPEAVRPFLDDIIAAMDRDAIVSTFQLESTVYTLASDRPETLAAHIDEIFDKLTEPLTIDLDRVEHVDMDESIEAASEADDDTIRTPVPFDSIIDEQDDGNVRPLSHALSSLVLTRPETVLEEESHVRDLLDADEAGPQFHGLRLINAAGLAGDVDIGRYADVVSALLVDGTSMRVRGEAATTLDTIAEIDPEATAPVVPEVATLLEDITPVDDVGEHMSELVTYSLGTMVSSIASVPVTDLPQVETLLSILSYEGEAARYATELLATIADADSEAVRHHRSTVIQWCTSDRSPPEQAAAVETLRHTGSRTEIEGVMDIDEW